MAGSNDAAKNSVMQAIVVFLWPRQTRSNRAYRRSSLSRKRTTVFSYDHFFGSFFFSTILPFSITRFLPFSISDASIGVSDMATVVDVQTAIVTIQPNSLNRIPDRPGSIVSGTNTATITRVVAITEIHTSLVA